MPATNKKVLIDLKPLIADLELLAKYEDDYRQSIILGVIHTIRNRPVIEAAEVVHARWEQHCFEIECSNCGSEALRNAFNEYVYSAYCPNCGAMMDLEEK
jgi:Zn finger protein HypA/HybF involved in hydrogenase expression